jgi:hypothetical protein
LDVEEVLVLGVAEVRVLAGEEDVVWADKTVSVAVFNREADSIAIIALIRV